jgi:hypothetical protein
MAGSGKLEEMIGPNTDPKAPEDSEVDTVCGFATEAGCATGDRMTLLSGVRGPSCVTAEEARR